MNRPLSLFAFGAVAGTLCDRMHYAGGAVLYPGEPSAALAGQPFWVPPLFASAAVGLVYGHRWSSARFGGAIPPASLTEVAAKMIAFVAAYAATALFHAHAWILTGVLLAAFIPLALRERYSGFVPYAVACALSGWLVEGTLTSVGAFAHARPWLFGVPSWLPVLYLWAALFGAALDRFLQRSVLARPVEDQARAAA